MGAASDCAYYHYGYLRDGPIRIFSGMPSGYIFKRTLGCILRKDHVTDENDKGLLSPYEAIATAVGGSVGFGNIAGVATAVTTGGPGAVLWMWLTAYGQC